MAKIFLTGSNGQLGRALQSLFDKDPSVRVMYSMLEHEVAIWEKEILSDTNGKRQQAIALDITDENSVMGAITAFMPDIVINCAAHTAVDLCESEPEKAYSLNAQGVEYLANAASKVDAKFVQVSTDYVFDGTKEQVYTEEDSPNPQSVYGETKLQGEILAKRFCEKVFIVRTAWVYGDGKNFIKTMLRLSETNDTIRVVNDQHGSPTSALELARAILRIMDSEQYGIYHATCEGDTTWYEFAREIFRLTSKEVNVVPITTKEYPTPAKRPAYSVLLNGNLSKLGYTMKSWQEALEEYFRLYMR
ncbi:MAG TPA: dTDP-4-dehydrorhamnose reductase [Lachnospiraceae bacterium]|nr:dTDP-4-dehydrorhamnose reductase [Lachnospiraceae bacterium]